MPRLLPQLPLEIIIDILSRLPVKPLLRFKCVSKSWCSLISNNPKFAKLHLHYAKLDANDNRRRLILSTYPFQSIDHEACCDGHEYNTVTRDLSYPLKSPKDIEFVGSCDGLISAVFDSNRQIIVWNPSTGESRELPAASSFPDDKLFYGFGYDSYVDDYKIVRGIISSSSTQVKMEVFSLKGCTWGTIQDLHFTVSLQGSATYLNGILHWLSEEYDSNKRTVIVSFDLVKEKFLEMIVVPDHVPQNMGIDLKVLGDFLCVCATTHTLYCDAWTIKGYGAKACWNRLFNFSSDPLPGCKYWF